MNREHPMLMKGPLVRSTLAGRKTQTRRLVTPQNSTAYGWPSARAVWPRLDWSRVLPGTMVQPGGPPVPLWRVPLRDAPEREQDARVLILPRVRAGDALWIRETWGRLDGNGYRIVYRADGEQPERIGYPDDPVTDMRWFPSIHMPRSACRIVLPVTSVRAERLQEITEENARGEGVEPMWKDGAPGTSHGPTRPLPHITSFVRLWDDINGRREGARWSDNPPLWVYGWRALA